MLQLIAQTSNGGNPLAILLPFLLLGGLFYFMILRPQQRRARAQQALINETQVGDEVITTAGIYGTVTAIDDDEGPVTLEIAPGIEIKLVRAGIGRRLTDDDAYDGGDDAYGEDDDPDDGDAPADAGDAEDHPDRPGHV